MKLHLDFAKPELANATWIWVLLLAAILFAIATGYQYSLLNVQLAGLNEQLQHRQHTQAVTNKAPPPSRQAQTAQHAQVKQANMVLEELSYPWPALFTLLESVSGPDVALLAIRPDAAKGRLRIAGEARHLAAALDYVRKLGASGAMHDVVLEEHEVVEPAIPKLQDQSQQESSPPEPVNSARPKPVHFTLSARWQDQ